MIKAIHFYHLLFCFALPTTQVISKPFGFSIVSTSNLEEEYEKYKKEGDELFKKGDYSKALKKYKVCLEVPNFSDDTYANGKIEQCEKAIYLRIKAETALDQNKGPEAVEAFKLILVMNPDDDITKKSLATHWENQGYKQYQNQHFAEAKIRYQEALKYDKKSQNSLVMIENCEEKLVIIKSKEEIKQARDNKKLEEQVNKEKVLNSSQINARSQILKRLDTFNHPDYRIAIELIPVSGDEADLRDTLMKALYLKGNVPTFDTTMRALIKVTNLGDKPCYFSIINVSSNGIVEAVLPSSEASRNEMFLPEKGSKYISSDLFGFFPPYGDETLIGFATKKTVNLTPILDASFLSNKTDNTPLNVLLSNAYTGTRGISAVDSQKLEGSIYKFYYKIITK